MLQQVPSSINWATMMRLVVLASLAFMVPMAAQAQNAGDAICPALIDLKKEAVESRRPQQISVGQLEAMQFACRLVTKNKTQQSFCSVALKSVGIEFIHAFPWKIYDCLLTEKIRPAIVRSNVYTGIGRQKIIHLTATWKDRARIRIDYEPKGEDTGPPAFKGLYGWYHMSVWMPE